MSRSPLALLVFAVLFSSAVAAQSPSCQGPVLMQPAQGTNLFNDRQELKLAAILHRNVEQDLKMMEDPSLTGELERVGDRVAASFPKSGIRFHYYIVDIPQANAFSQTGGNIYFSRKLIAMFRTEDELAGVIAHEMGHIVTHQEAIGISRTMRAVLGVTALGDDDDVESKYNELLDSYQIKPEAFKRNNSESHEQGDADHVAVYALGAAGYDVKTLPAFWDRFAENKGKKGNFFTDLFGTTTEEQRRFRDMLKNAAAVPEGCVGKQPHASKEEFKKWQTAVLSYEGIGHPEKLDALVERKPLDPPLRSEVRRMKFSPDGKYILAEDEAAITVMNRADLKPLFRIDADDARSAQFSEDSKTISFYTMTLFTSPRVEVWDIAEKSLRGAFELRLRPGCSQSALSPNGKYFACMSIGDVGYGGGVTFDLRVFDVESGDKKMEKKDIFTADVFSLLSHLFQLFGAEDSLQKELTVGAIHFTPDSKYVLFGRDGTEVAFESENGNKLNLPGSIRDIMQADFSFLDGGRMVGDGGKGYKGAVVKFPTGEVIKSNLAMGLSHVDGAARGDYVVVYPVKDRAAAIFDINQGKFLASSTTEALDIYDTEFIREQKNGQLTVSDIVSHKDLSTVYLNEGPLGKVVAADASDDLNYIAISGTLRGAVWDIKKGTRVLHARHFDEVAVDDKGLMFADFPAEGEAKRMIALVDTANNAANTIPVDPDEHVRQLGKYLMDCNPVKKGEWKKEVDCKLKNIRSNSVLWERKLPNGFRRYFVAPETDSLVYAYDVDDKDGKGVLDQNPELRAKVNGLKTKAHAYAIEALDIRTGKSVGVTAIDTGKGSFRLRDAFSAGSRLIIADTSDRVQVFGFDGLRIGRLQAHSATATRDGRWLAANVGRGKVAIYDLEKFRLVDELDFTSRIAMMKFSSTGDRFLVVTREQKAYYFDVKALSGGSQMAAAH